MVTKTKTRDTINMELDYRSYRRDVVKALGAGAVLTTGTSTALAQQDGEQTTQQTPGDGATETGTVHTVEMLIRGPPTNPA
ncbi:hypothetical protein VB773_18415 [Haloarculaceae archaeon H-GB2-1]|nr:hypothetical protein [Haloarculaceae archaeon H-GB1-1]MEA5409347.1 hypothetical protein [Haloarculaceae archaeon H-GB2-1]